MGDSLAPTGRHKSRPSNLLLTAHRRVHHFLAHGLLNGADGLVAGPIADRLLELRVELADREPVPTLHLLYRVGELLFQPVRKHGKNTQERHSSSGVKDKEIHQIWC